MYLIALFGTNISGRELALVAGVIVVLAGAFGLLLSLLLWGPLDRRRDHRGGHRRGAPPPA